MQTKETSGEIAMTQRWKVLVLGMAVALLAVFSVPRAKAEEPAVKPLRALLVLGGCCHDYATQQELLAKGIAERAHVEVVVAYDPDKSTSHLNPIYENADWADGFDVVIHDECSAQVTDLALVGRILEPHQKGLPSVVLHCGMHCYRTEGYPKAITPWFEFTGLQSTGHGPQKPIDIHFLKDSSPIADGLVDWTTINEELYNNSSGTLLETATAIARGKQVVEKKGEATTAEGVVVWTNNYRNTARVFATTLGHNNDTVADDRYLDLITRGLLWSCGQLNDKYLR